MSDKGDASHDPAVEWANLQRAYVELRTELQLTDDPRLQVELLRKLSSYRYRIAELDEAIETTTVSQTAASASTPGPSPIVPSAGGKIRSGPTPEGTTSTTPPPPAQTDGGRVDRDAVTADRPASGTIEALARPSGAGTEAVALEIEIELEEEPDAPPAAVVAVVVVEEVDRDGGLRPATVPGPAPVRTTRVTGRLVDQPLTLRFVVEGAPEAGTTTVVRQLAEQFHAEVHTTPLVADTVEVSWLEFTSGSYEGQPIRFEVCCLQGADSRARRHLRSLCDAVILVADSTPAGLGAALPHLAELNAHRDDLGGLDAPELAVFAHKEDLLEALDATAVAARLQVPVETKVVSTTRERAGFRQGFGLATSTAVRRTQNRDRADLPRTTALDHDGFVTAIRSLTLVPTGSAHPAPTGPTDPELSTLDPAATASTGATGPEPSAPPATASTTTTPPPITPVTTPIGGTPTTLQVSTEPPADPTGEIPGPPAQPAAAPGPHRNGVATGTGAGTSSAPPPAGSRPGPPERVRPARSSLRRDSGGQAESTRPASPDERSLPNGRVPAPRTGQAEGPAPDGPADSTGPANPAGQPPDRPADNTGPAAPAGQPPDRTGHANGRTSNGRSSNGQSGTDRPAPDGTSQAGRPDPGAQTPNGQADSTGRDGGDAAVVRELRSALSEMDVAPRIPAELPLGTAPADQGVIDLAGITRLDLESRAPRSRYGTDPSSSSPRATLPRAFTPGDLAAISEGDRPGTGSAEPSPDDPARTVGGPVDDDHGQAPPPFIAGRQPRPRSSRSVPPSVLDTSPSPFQPEHAARPHPRDRAPRPVGSDERNLGSLFGPRVGSGNWPPAPSATDRVGPYGSSGTTAADVPGPLRRSALRRLISALKG